MSKLTAEEIQFFKDRNDNYYVQAGEYKVRLSDGTRHDGTTIGNFEKIDLLQEYKEELDERETLLKEKEKWTDEFIEKLNKREEEIEELIKEYTNKVKKQ